MIEFCRGLAELYFSDVGKCSVYSLLIKYVPYITDPVYPLYPSLHAFFFEENISSIEHSTQHKKVDTTQIRLMLLASYCPTFYKYLDFKPKPALL